MEFLAPPASLRPRRAPARLLVAGLLVAGLALLPARAASPAPPPPTIAGEYQVKAVFLFNFAQFVEWPARAFAAKDAPLVIGVLGRDPFGPYLDEIVRGEKVGAHPLVVRRPTTAEEIAACHLLFVSRSEAAAVGRLAADLAGRSVLTLGDADNFTRDGGMVRFVTESGKIRLRINLQAAKASGLIISSKIIRPATIVSAGQD